MVGEQEQDRADDAADEAGAFPGQVEMQGFTDVFRYERASDADAGSDEAALRVASRGKHFCDDADDESSQERPEKVHGWSVERADREFGLVLLIEFFDRGEALGLEGEFLVALVRGVGRVVEFIEQQRDGRGV